MSRTAAGTTAAAAALLLAWWGLAQVLPVGVDFYHWYYLVPQRWLAGETRLYDAQSAQFFSPPWAVWLFLPFTMLEPRAAMAAFTLFSLITIAAVSADWARERGAARPLPVALASALGAYSLSTYLLGTPDAWALVGAYLGYRGLRDRRPWLLGTGLVLGLIRPQAVLLAVPLLALAARDWPWRDQVKAGAIPAAVVLASAVVFGWDWPLRWYESYKTLPPSAAQGVTTTYSALQMLAGVPYWVSGAACAMLAAGVGYLTWRQASSARWFEVVMTAGAVVAPYVRSPSFIALLAIPWAGLAARRPLTAALVYLLTLPTIIIPLFWYRELGEFWIRWVPLMEVAFPIVLLGALVATGNEGTEEQRYRGAGGGLPLPPGEGRGEGRSEVAALGEPGAGQVRG